MLETIKSIILDSQEARPDTGVPRRLRIETVPGKATVCIGVRRSGKSTYMLPMHYRTETSRPDLEPLDTFVAAMGIPQAEVRPKLLVTATNLPLNMQVVALPCDSRAG